MSYKKFSAIERGHGFHHEEQNKGNGRKPLRCWTCGGEHHWSECPSHQGGRPHIYSAQEAQIVGDVGQSIPHIYATMDTKQANQQVSIIEMEGKLCQLFGFD